MKYIGVVDWASEGKNGEKIGGVRPLYEVSGPRWVAVTANEFPPEGKVFWYRVTAKKNDLVSFNVRESFNEDKYKYHIDRGEPILEILDFRNLGSVEEVRKAFATGIRYSRHLPEKSFILCKGGTIVGPLNLSRSADGVLAYDAAQIHRIPCYSTDDTPTREIHLDSQTRTVFLDQNLLNICSYVDWDSNRNVVKRAVEHAISSAHKSTTAAINVKELIADTYQNLKEGDDPAELSLQINRLKRAVELIKQVDISDEWAVELIDKFASLPTFKNEIDNIRTQTKIEALEDIEIQLRAELQKVEEAQNERGKLEGEIQELNERLELLKNEVESHTGDIDREIEKRIEAIVDKPASFIADVAFLNAILPHLSNGKNSGGTGNAKPDVEWGRSERKISSADELKKLILKHFRSIGVKAEVGFCIHAALASGIMPILGGFNARAAIDTYSRIALGGRVFRIPVSPASIECRDLFGGRDESDQARSRTDLVGVLEAAAKNNDEPAVVVFEGINRAPTESFFVPILEAIFLGASLPSYSSNSQLRDIKWPANLYPIATIVEGPTTLPLCISVLSRSLVFDALNQFGGQADAPLSEVELSSGLFDQVELGYGIDDEIFEQFPEFDQFKMLTNRFIGGLGHFYDLDDGKAITQVLKIVVEALVFPLIALTISEEERDAAIKKIPRLKIGDFHDVEIVRTMFDRVGGRVT